MPFEKYIISLLYPVRKALEIIKFRYGRMRLARLMDCGLKVGKNVYIENGVSFDQIYPYLIEIGDNCRIAMGVKILAHDATIFQEFGVNRIAPVQILEGTFIGERAIILPGVTIGPNAMVAAGAMVNRDIGEGKIAAGNPARPYANFSDMLEKYRQMITPENVFSKKDLESGSVRPSEIIKFFEKQQVAFMRGVPSNDPAYVNADMEYIRNSASQAFKELNRVVQKKQMMSSGK